MSDNPYSRVYWSVMDDPKFDGVRENPRHLGSWLILLLTAEMSYPVSAYVPATVPKASLQALVDAELVLVSTGGRYKVRGLAAEREMRSQNGRNAAAKRWHSNGNADPMLAKTRRAETRQDEQPRARPNTVDRNPDLRAMRDAQRERYKDDWEKG